MTRDKIKKKPKRMCCIQGCRNSKANDSLSIHKFPKDPNYREKWRIRLKLPKEMLTKETVVCSYHFTPEDFCKQGFGKIPLRKTLRKNAIPSRNIPNMTLDDAMAKTNEITSMQARNNASLNDMANSSQQSYNNESLHKITEKPTKQFLPTKMKKQLEERFSKTVKNSGTLHSSFDQSWSMDIQQLPLSSDSSDLCYLPENSAEPYHTFMPSCFEKMCRICGIKSDGKLMIPIFGKVSLKIGLMEKINRCLQMTVCKEDNLPQQVCTLCTTKLNYFHTLVKTCEEVNARLTALKDNIFNIQNITQPPEDNNVQNQENFGLGNALNDSPINIECSISDSQNTEDVIFSHSDSTITKPLEDYNTQSQDNWDLGYLYNYSTNNIECSFADSQSSEEGAYCHPDTSMTIPMEDYNAQSPENFELGNESNETPVNIECSIADTHNSEDVSLSHSGSSENQDSLEQVNPSNYPKIKKECSLTDSHNSECSIYTHSNSLEVSALPSSSIQPQTSFHFEQGISKNKPRLRKIPNLQHELAISWSAGWEPRIVNDEVVVIITKNTGDKGTCELYILLVHVLKEENYRTMWEKVSSALHTFKEMYKTKTPKKTNYDVDLVSFFCTPCSLGFTSKAEIVHHFDQTHPEMVYKCPKCEEICCCTSEVFKKHLQLHRDNVEHASETDLLLQMTSFLDVNVLEKIEEEEYTFYKVIRLGEYSLQLDNVQLKAKLKVLIARAVGHTYKTSDLNSEVVHSLQKFFESNVRKFTRKKPMTIKSVNGTIESTNKPTKDSVRKAPKVSECTSTKSLKKPKDSIANPEKSFKELKQSSNTHKCCHCSKTVRQEYLNFHIDKHHGGGVQLLCLLCEEAFVATGEPQPHMQHQPPFRCPESKCKKPFDTEDELLKHTATLHSRIPGLCDLCGKMFKDVPIMKAHRKYHFMKPLEPILCSICNKPFQKSKNLEKHMLVHTEKYPCSICGKPITRAAMKIHLLSHNAVKEKPKYPCKHCEKVLTCPRTLLFHENRHLGMKTIRCPICMKRFLTKELMLVHQESHSIGNTVYIPPHMRKVDCPICKKTIVNKYNLKYHLMAHSGERPFKCENCDQSFVSKGLLMLHNKHYHTPGELDKKKKCHKCEECGKELFNKHLLKDHLARHRGERNYKCKFCDKSFYHNSNRIAHISRVHSAKSSRLFEKTKESKNTESSHVPSIPPSSQFACAQPFNPPTDKKRLALPIVFNSKKTTTDDSFIEISLSEPNPMPTEVVILNQKDENIPDNDSNSSTVCVFIDSKFS